ncbi:hypothetical protein HPB51_017859 [Rhipicephalus microplus]|uniref:Sulfotransferase domain-containing protein n=1 Tax=Rhipicephalus microplus TaxID=6941 RepID=A0A9J6E3B9_RHIMP|nr:hypothetical protein HPB51_017859 [Rhipicephalus microplus]
MVPTQELGITRDPHSSAARRDTELKTSTNHKTYLTTQQTTENASKCGKREGFIVYSILTRAKPLPTLRELGLLSPFIDMIGAEAAENPSRSGPIMTHLPPTVLQPVQECKYIYVTRNPYDCAVSFYHFIKGFTPKTVIYGDYFDHLLPWYLRRGDDNVLFLTYEQLKEDTKGQVLKIADFLGDQHGAALREDETLFQRILDACSLENMKVFFKDPPAERIKLIVKAEPEACPKSTEPSNKVAERKVENHEGSGFVRKGIIGDWRNYFSPGANRPDKGMDSLENEWKRRDGTMAGPRSPMTSCLELHFTSKEDRKTS